MCEDALVSVNALLHLACWGDRRCWQGGDAPDAEHGGLKGRGEMTGGITFSRGLRLSTKSVFVLLVCCER